VPEANDGLRVPEERARAERVASLERRVTMTV
jgi:hypothetical protein